MKGLIPQRLDFLSTVHHRVAKFIEEQEEQDDLMRWANTPEVRPLMPDTTGYVPRKISDAVWSLIHHCML